VQHIYLTTKFLSNQTVFSYFHDRLFKTIQLLRNYDDVILLIDTDCNVNHSAIAIKIYAPQRNIPFVVLVLLILLWNINYFCNSPTRTLHGAIMIK